MTGAAGVLAAAALSASISTATAPRERILKATLPHAVELPYLLYLPAAYEGSPGPWPVILYLHGGSLRGGDIARLRQSALPKRAEEDPAFPFVVAAPHCADGEIWTDTEALSALVDALLRDYRTDPARVYVTGHSMGGRGALYLAHRLPGRFAAVLALSPVSPILAWSRRLAGVPLWLVGGENDALAPAAEARGLAQEIERAGGHPRLTILPGRDHGILDVYDRPDVFEWLLQHTAPSPKTR